MELINRIFWEGYQIVIELMIARTACCRVPQVLECGVFEWHFVGLVFRERSEIHPLGQRVVVRGAGSEVLEVSVSSGHILPAAFSRDTFARQVE